MTGIVNTKLGESRGKRRLWLEGAILRREGYQPGLRYDLHPHNGTLTLKLSEEGKYKISRRARNNTISPIIDLSAPVLAELFGHVEMLRVTIKAGSILVSAHKQEERVRERESRLLEKLRHGKPLAVASLFHGGGVLDAALHQGLERAGVKSKISLAIEMESQYLNASISNNPQLWDEHSIAINSPIQCINVFHNPPKADCLFAGIPCTGASKQGIAKNKLNFAEEHEAAGSMFFYFLQFVQALQPAIVIIENVPGYANTASYAAIQSVLQSLGYAIQLANFNGNDYGALEGRERMCAVAVSNGLSQLDLDLEHVPSLYEKQAKLADILEPVPLDSPRWKRCEYLEIKAERDRQKGNNFARRLFTGSESFCGCLSKGYQKMRSTEPFLQHPLNALLSRLFTPLEHCRLKRVPERMIAGLSELVAHQILGQSVVFSVFEAIGAALGRALQNLAAQPEALAA